MATNGLSEDVEKTAKDVQQKVEHVTEDVADSVEDLARGAYQRAEKARKNAVRQLYEGADELRSKARAASYETRDEINQMARDLERTAGNLNSQAEDEVAAAIATVQDNLWQSILTVFFVGLLAGWMLGKR